MPPERRKSPPREPKPRVGLGSIERLGPVTSASVLKCTGRNWEEWVTLLDRAGARELSHQQIVALLAKRHKLTPWWRQGVTSGYELHVGRRVEGQNLKGDYSTVATKTFAVSRAAAWRLLVSPRGQQAWLRPLEPLRLEAGEVFERADGAYGQLRTLKKGERLRLSWQEADWLKPSAVTVHVVARPGNKCLVVIQQDGLLKAELKEKLRAQWKSVLSELLDLSTTAR